MSEATEERCPYCNGVGTLPRKRVVRVEADRDALAVAVHSVGRLWGAVCSLKGEATRKRKMPPDADTLRALIRRCYLEAGDVMDGLPVAYRSGRTDHDVER
jgi:hypothetical protein